MLQRIWETKKGKWAVILAAIAVVAVIGSVSKGSTEALPGAAICIVVALFLASSAAKSINNPPPEPTLEDLGIKVPKTALQAFEDRGILPDLKGTPVMLNQSEQAVYDCIAIRTETKNRIVGHTRNSGGASIRVAKGVTIRTGGGGSQSVYGDVKTSSEGRFIVTTEKIVFSSQQKAFTAALSEITSVETYDDGMTIIAGKNTYVLELAHSHYPAAMIEKCRQMSK